MTTDCDVPVVVAGAGPAGVSAALWLDDFGVPFEWVDATGNVGGMLHRVHNRITNVPGQNFDDGASLTDAYRRQLRTLDLAPRTAEIDRVDVESSPILLTESKGETSTTRRVILTTGTRYRQLGIAGEQQGLGDYVSQSATADGDRVAGEPVAVVGGGDAGFENALRMADRGSPVTMLLRSAEFRARPSFVEDVQQHHAIDIAPIPSVVQHIEPIEGGCRLHIDRRDETTTLDVACLFVRIGVDPVVPGGCDGLSTDDDGHLIVDGDGRTSRDHILAAGDVTSTPLRCVATAVGQGARAARTCAVDLGYLTS